MQCVQAWGTVLYSGSGSVPQGAHRADPRAVKRWAVDEFERAAAMQSQVAWDINDIAGERGYPRAKEAREGEVAAAVYGAAGRENELAGAWRRARYETNEEATVPWYWPAATVIKSLKKKGLVKAAAAMRACMEGGWITQRKLSADGRAENDRCRCGKAAGTLWHKLAMCELSHDKREEAAAPKGLKDLMAQGRALVWDPLFSRGGAREAQVASSTAQGTAVETRG